MTTVHFMATFPGQPG